MLHIMATRSVTTNTRQNTNHTTNNRTLKAHETSSRLHVKAAAELVCTLSPRLTLPWADRRTEGHTNAHNLFFCLFIGFSDSGEGYKDSSALRLDGLTPVGGVYINENTYRCLQSAALHADIPRLV